MVYEAELDGESILIENCPVTFEDMVQSLLWEKLYESYQNDTIGLYQHFKEADTSQSFIESEAVSIVLQAIGYTLLNTELYSEND